MAEKGIVVQDAVSGESIACRDATLVDDESNARLIQLFDKAARPVVYQRTSAVRASVTSDDDVDLDPLPTVIANNLVDVSDAEQMVVWATVYVASSETGSPELVVTPIVVSDDGTPVAVACLAPMLIRPCDPSGSPAIASVLIINGGSGVATTFLTQVVVTPTYGAKKLGLHVTINGTAVGTVTANVYAAPMSCAGRDGAIDDKVSANTWGSGFPPPA